MLAGHDHNSTNNLLYYISFNSKTNMCSILLFGFILSGYGDAVTYDQRQTGELNVQLDLKDLHIFGIMKGGKEEYVDYDYAYDYSEMTIKPPNGTTSKPLNVTTSAPVTVKENSTIAIAVTNIEQTTESIVSNNSSHQFVETTQVTLNSTNIPTTETNLGDSTTINTTASGSLNNGTMIPTAPANCKKGFVRNEKGHCELKLQGATNALLKIVKLSQRLKLRREKNKDETDSA